MINVTVPTSPHFTSFFTCSPPQADVTRLGELLLADKDRGDRMLCALIVRVEERKMLEVREE